jgi:hypothetical protein
MIAEPWPGCRFPASEASLNITKFKAHLIVDRLTKLKKAGDIFIFYTRYL